MWLAATHTPEKLPQEGLETLRPARNCRKDSELREEFHSPNGRICSCHVHADGQTGSLATQRDEGRKDPSDENFCMFPWRNLLRTKRACPRENVGG